MTTSPHHHDWRLASMLLPMSLAACGPSQAEIEDCRMAPLVRNQEVRTARSTFYRTDAGRKYKTMTSAQIAARSQDYPGFRDMEAINVFNAQIESAERRYQAARKKCAEKGL